MTASPGVAERAIFVRLYLKSRHIPGMLVGALGALVLMHITVGALERMLPQTYSPVDVRTQLLTLFASIMGMCIAQAAVSPYEELDAAVPALVKRARVLVTTVLAIVIAASYALSVTAWNAPEQAEWMMARNVFGFAGLTLLALPWLGASRAWLVTMIWAGLAIFSQRQDDTYPAWAWSMLPAPDWSTWIISGVLIVGGALTLWVMPFTDREA